LLVARGADSWSMVKQSMEQAMEQDAKAYGVCSLETSEK
jgi:hypothetical protein